MLKYPVVLKYSIKILLRYCSHKLQTQIYFIQLQTNTSFKCINLIISTLK